MAGRPWIKLHLRWLSSPSHAKLTAPTLGLGALLMLVIADQGEDDGEGGRWVTEAIPLPGNCAQDVVGSCLSCVRHRVDLGRRRVQQLVKVGSFAIRNDGAFGCPNWWKWQENPSAKRVRKHREASVTVTREEEVEVEEEVEEDHAVAKATVVPSFAGEVLAHMRAAAHTLTGRNGGPQDRKSNLDIVRKCTKREGATLDDWKRVIDAQLANLRTQPPDKWHYLSLSTITRPLNWARLMDAPRPAPRTNAHAQVVIQASEADRL